MCGLRIVGYYIENNYRNFSMLSRSQRFHGRTSLRPVYNRGASAHGRMSKMLYLASQKSDSRAAVVVSKKVHKSAVVRNRIRRRVYAQLKPYLAQVPSSVDVVIVVKDAALASVPADVVAKELTTLIGGVTRRSDPAAPHQHQPRR